MIVIFFVINSNYSNAALIKDQTLLVDGSARTYDLFIPSATYDNARPLVVLLHGHYGDADVMTGENGKKTPYKIWLTIAEREGWYLVIPDGENGSDNNRGWNDCRKDAFTNPKTNDVKFLQSLIDRVSSQYSINQDRIYAHGTSNGGNMVFRLAQEIGDEFKAVAAIVASMPENNKCRESQHPISILVMNGTDDPLLPYDGGSVGRRDTDKKARGTVLSTDKTIQYWLSKNKITTSPTTEIFPNISRRDRSTVEVSRYRGGIDDTEVILYKIIGGGHTEPSLKEHYRAIYKMIVGQQNRDIEMAEEVFQFFDRHK